MGSVQEFKFKPPPECPVFQPTTEEFKDSLGYIRKIRPVAEKFGICRIRPPDGWNPPFTVDTDKLRFTPRIQRLNELEACTRVKLNFLDQIAKFWDLQGSTMKIPAIDRKVVDLYTLYRNVKEQGGMDAVNKKRCWNKIAAVMGYPVARNTGQPLTMLKNYGKLLKDTYERILYPYELFQDGKHFADDIKPEIKEEEVEVKEEPIDDDKDYVPHEIPSRQAITPPSDRGNRRSKRYKKPICDHDKDYVPHEIPSRQAIKPPSDRGNRRSKRCPQIDLTDDDKDYIPHDIPTRQAIAPPCDRRSRRSKRFVSADIQEIKNTQEVLESNGNKELRRLSFYGAGPKMPGLSELSRKKELVYKKRRIPMLPHDDPFSKYICPTCKRGDAEELLLLCDGCDESYHTFCLVPPLSEIPKGDWRCPKCIAEEVSKPQAAFGFEQAQQAYTLTGFGAMADQFKADYFNMPVHLVPSTVVENEFWRIMASIDDNVSVEYGADLHTMDHGSGFPTDKCRNILKSDEEYLRSMWNLNNLPVLESSVLGYLNTHVSGMVVPWMYAGMVFSTFCWHVEDHWSYSINYLHWGEPKTWYGVPGSEAKKLEEAMKKNAVELFHSQPDLMHQLVTIMNPNKLMDDGVSVYRTDQQAGEFVITFPRAYHAGFNQGFNFAEAVNFAPVDWLSKGRECVQHYSELRRYCVFSHDELVCTMAVKAEKLSIEIADAAMKEMEKMVNEEKKYRKLIHDWGVTEAERVTFELVADDSRQCEFCKTTLFLSALACKCTTKLVCLRHYKSLCECDPIKHYLKYRYNLKELPEMLRALKERAEDYDKWLEVVADAMSSKGDDRLEMQELKALIDEGERKGFPETELKEKLRKQYDRIEKCDQIAHQLAMVGVRTRTIAAREGKSLLTLEEVKSFHDELTNLHARVPDAAGIESLLESCMFFHKKAVEVLQQEVPKLADVKECWELGSRLYIELPQLPRVKQKYDQSKWMSEVQDILETGEVTLEDLEKCLDSSIAVPPCPTVESMRSQLQALLLLGMSAEDKSRLHIQSKMKYPVEDIKAIIDEVKGMPLSLPNLNILRETYAKAAEWKASLDQSYKGSLSPYFEEVEKLLHTAKDLPVELSGVATLENTIAAACTWKERVARTFVKKNSHYTLMEILLPRNDVEDAVSKYKKRRPRDEASAQKKMEQVLGIQLLDAPTEKVVNAYKSAEVREINAMRNLRIRNLQKRAVDRSSGKYCVCGKGLQADSKQCQLCKDYFHVGCVPAHRYNPLKAGPGKGGVGGENKFLCPCCCRSRRPRMETILSLLVAMGKLNVRLPEGEALQCLAERAISWQDRARTLLSTEETSAALAKLSLMSQKVAEAAQKEKAEKIVNNEMSRAGRLGQPETPVQVETISSTVSSTVISEEVVQSTSTGDPDKPPGNSLVDQTPAPTLGSISSYSSSEHAYSSASKPGGVCIVNSRKHARKSPLVPRSLEPSRLSLSDSTMAQLEELMMKADLLEMSMDENTHIWRLLLATRGEPTSDELLQDCQDLDIYSNDESSDKEKPKEKPPKKKPDAKKRKSDMCIGNLPKKSRSRSNSRDSIVPRERVPRDSKPTQNPTSLSRSKHPLESAPVPTATPVRPSPAPTPVRPSASAAVRNARRQSQRKTLPVQQAEKKLRLGPRPPAPPRRTKKPFPQSLPRAVPTKHGRDSDSSDESEEECGFWPCKRPTGSVDWVQCDGQCALWFHMTCVGVRKTDVSPDKDYLCPKCLEIKNDDDDDDDEEDDDDDGDDEDDNEDEEMSVGRQNSARFSGR